MCYCYCVIVFSRTKVSASLLFLLLYGLDQFLPLRRIYCSVQVTGDFEAINNHSRLHVLGVQNPFMLHMSW
jgi:hypothetical protein